jgi:hypothetical protein
MSSTKQNRVRKNSERKRDSKVNRQQPTVTSPRTEPSGSSTGDGKVSVFISYARSDYRIAEILREELIDLGRDRVDCFLDIKTIESGEGWEKKLEEGLKNAHWLLCIFTGEQSEYCGYEVGVFTAGKVSESERETSRVVCFHDVPNYPGIFRSYENRAIEYPPERLISGQVFDEAGFYGESDLVRFFQDFAKFKDLYVPHNATDFQRQSEAFIRYAQAITEAFRLSRGDDVKSDTPTQLGFEIIVPSKAGEALQSIPPDAMVKGTYETFRLFHMMPPFQNGQLPSALWSAIKDASKRVSTGYLPWIERLERDMLNAATGQALTETEATFGGNGTTYRAILVRHIVQFNGTHRFGVVFFRTLPSQFLGDQNTSMILAGLVVASRLRFAYLEQPDKVRAWFSDEVSDGDFAARYRQLLYDLERMRQESMELGLLDHNLFVQSFGPARRAIAEEFLAEYARAKTTFEASLPDSAAPIGPDNRPKIRSAILTFLNQIEDQNARFLRAALEAYKDELDNQLRKKNVIPATGVS